MFHSFKYCRSTRAFSTAVVNHTRFGVCGLVVWPKYPASHDDRRVLLIARGKEPMKGRWCLPGGSVEFGEDYKKATIRELKEECDLNVNVVSLLDASDIFSKTKENEPLHYILLHSVCEPSIESLILPEIKAGDDAAAAMWVTLKDVHQLEMENKAIPGLTSLVMDGYNRYWQTK